MDFEVIDPKLALYSLKSISRRIRVFRKKMIKTKNKIKIEQNGRKTILEGAQIERIPLILNIQQ